MGSELVDTVRHLLGGTPRKDEIADIDAWWEVHRAAADPYVTSIARAFATGYEADRLGYAFASGYTEALGSLVPSLAGVRAALCVTEADGNRPREMNSTLTATQNSDAFAINGDKSHVTLGEFAEELLVVVSAGRDDHERNRLRMVRIPVTRAGVSLETLPELPFCPEIPHAKLSLRDVEVTADELLEGDAYDAYVKPFRTTEDLHVLAATVGYLMREAQRAPFPKTQREALAAFVAAIYPMGLAEPLDAGVHVALGGVFRRLELLIDQLDWAACDDEIRARFERDRPLLSVATSARNKRLEIAWKRLGQVG